MDFVQSFDYHPDMVTPPRRRWHQFGIKGLFAAVAILALPLGWHMRNVHRQQAIVARIQQLGGSVTYDYQLVATQNGLKTRVANPKASTLGSWLGVDHVHDVVSVTLSNANVTDDDLRLLAQLPKLQGIDLQESNMLNDSLECLKAIPDLRFLNLRHTSIDDDGLEFIICHKNLKLLNLSQTHLSDAGLARLESLDNLAWMDLSQTDLTDNGLQHFGSLDRLTWLVVRATGVTYEGVKRLQAALPKATIIFP
ncbi:MAG TPA: hypothetical protein VGJ26_06390 [Pirellulales bacterium]